MEKTPYTPPAPAPLDPDKINTRVDSYENGAHLSITDANGKFLANMTYHVRDPSCLAILTQKFGEWMLIQAQQSGKVQPVAGAVAQQVAAAVRKTNGHGA